MDQPGYQPLPANKNNNYQLENYIQVSETSILLVLFHFQNASVYFCRKVLQCFTDFRRRPILRDGHTSTWLAIRDSCTFDISCFHRRYRNLLGSNIRKQFTAVLLVQSINIQCFPILQWPVVKLPINEFIPQRFSKCICKCSTFALFQIIGVFNSVQLNPLSFVNCNRLIYLLKNFIRIGNKITDSIGDKYNFVFILFFLNHLWGAGVGKYA